MDRNDDFLSRVEAEQREMASEVVAQDIPVFEDGRVTGLDVAYSDSIAVGCAVTLDSLSLEKINVEVMFCNVKAPYIPGLFQLREGPVLLKLIQSLNDPGPILIDGNGILHPRRFGLASYVGVILDVQTIGVAKNLLLGELGPRSENTAMITDDGEVLGVALWVLQRERPVYVSIGHRISLSTAVEIAQRLSVRGYPEPLRLAHEKATSELKMYVKRQG